jgi:hypothetical protein
LIAAFVSAPPAAAVWRDVAVRDSPRAAIATCVRATGQPGLIGLLGPLEPHHAPYDLLRVTPDGITRAARVRLGILAACPAAAADPNGFTIVAAPASSDGRNVRVKAALAEPGAAFGPAVDLGSAGPYPDAAVAAVSARGDAVVAWVQQRFPTLRRPSGAMRVVAALRPAGGSFGAPHYLTPWRRDDFFPGGHVAAGMDAAGTATVAWEDSLPGHGEAAPTSTVVVATASPGASFGRPQTLSRSAHDLTTLTLAVAPNGAALLAHDGGAIWRFVRAAGSARFTRLEPLTARSGDPAQPAAAIAPDGSAVLAWRTDDPTFLTNAGVAMSERTGTRAFSKPRRVWAGEAPRSFGISALDVAISHEGVFAPTDDGNTALRATLGAGGRFLLAWGVERRSILGDAPIGIRLVRGVLGGRPAPAGTVGCPCRSVNGLAPLTFAGGEPGLAFADNLTRWFGSDGEFERGGGRLHIAADRPPVASPAPPSLHVERPRTRTLKYEQSMPVSVRCGGPCDLRAYVLDARGRAHGAGTAALHGAGRARVVLEPRAGGHLAPRPGGRVGLLVRGWTPGGASFSRATSPMVLRRAPVAPLLRLLDVHAVRQGDAILVSWRTDRPAGGVFFFATGHRSRRSPAPLAVNTREGDAQTSYRMRLRPHDDGTSAARIRWVRVTVVRERAPHDDRVVVVPVTG